MSRTADPTTSKDSESVTTNIAGADSVPYAPEQNDSWRVKFGLLLFGLSLSLFFFEISFRILEPRFAASPTWSDRPKSFYLPESSVDNRDFAHTQAKAEGTFRIVVIGDSFTFGGKGHFDDTFSKRLERMLNLNEQQRRVEVLNWGVPGYSSTQENVLVKRALKHFEPDLIILEITLNDPERHPYRALPGHAKDDGSVEFHNPLLTHWHSLSFVLRRVYNSVSHRQYADYYFDLFSNPSTWNRFKTAVRGMKDDSDEHHVPFFAMVFPLFSHRLDDGYPFQKIHDQLRDFLKLQGIQNVDLLPSYRNIPPDRLQAIPGRDSHPNEIAHRIAADALYDGLLAAGLLPEDVVIKKRPLGGRPLKLKHKHIQ